MAIRLLALLFPVAALLLPVFADELPSRGLDFIEQHCIDRQDEIPGNGGLNLEDFLKEIGDPLLEAWQKACYGSFQLPGDDCFHRIARFPENPSRRRGAASSRSDDIEVRKEE